MRSLQSTIMKKKLAPVMIAAVVCLPAFEPRWRPAAAAKPKKWSKKKWSKKLKNAAVVAPCSAAMAEIDARVVNAAPVVNAAWLV